ncbi:MAG: sugar phosphate isomerase/epimerase, partial [Planctomycetes bacterium]|nr:sugar phosphate isomerase/epimerase [Planctomycetota bacterium]
MKFGMNLLLWSGGIEEEHYPVLEMLKETGFDGVEIPLFAYDVAQCAALGKKLDELELERTAVTVRNEEDNPISTDASVRAAGVDLNK